MKKYDVVYLSNAKQHIFASHKLKTKKRQKKIPITK